MSNFDEMCKEAARRFIRTVAIIDDVVTYDMNETPYGGQGKKKPVKPPVSGLKKSKNDNSSPAIGKESNDAEPQADRDNSSMLDARAIINTFADMDIACCIQSPRHEESPLERATKLASFVDVLVVDWALDKKDKSLPRDIIKSVLEEDCNTSGRMRLIVIYTAQSFIDQMLKDLNDDAKTVYKKGLAIDKSNFLIKINSLRIVILNKITVPNLPTGARIVPFDELPNAIISEFAELVKGIIPGAMMHSIAAMREKTHTLLSILNSNLDGAYCLHRALLDEPSDSVDFAMNLIANEIETIIQSDSKARQFADRDGIKAWLNQYAGDKEKLHYCSSSLSVRTIENCILNGQLSKKDGVNTIKREYASNWVQTKDDMEETLKNDHDEEITLDDAEELIRQNKWDRIKGCEPPNKTSFAEALYSTSKGAINGCKELSRLQCTTRDMVSRPYIDGQYGPSIHLGSILKVRKKVHRDSVDDWFLCLTPLCDSVRLNKEEKVEFLFLHLYPGKKGSADIFIERQKGKFEPLIFKAKNKKIELSTIPFYPNKNDRIRAKRWRNEWRIKSNNISYQWVAELRYNKALAVANRVAASTSRVGIDEFEWLRDQATLKN